MSEPGPVRHRWVFALLRRAGCRVEPAREGVFTAYLADGLAGRLHRETVRFTFQKRLAAAQEGVELASPGSWMHDQLLRYARERGTVTVCFLPVRPDLDPESLLRTRRRGFRELIDRVERRFGTVLLFTFRITFYGEPPEETLVQVAFDSERGKVIHRPPARKTLLAGEPEPYDGFAPAPPADVEAGFRAAWEALQDRVEARVQERRSRGRPQREREIAVLEQYYRQLIEEEKRLMKSRSTRRGQEESRHRIDHLKLEWERRIQEETERLEPRVVAALSAVAQARVPLERWSCRIGTEGEGEEREVWIDLARADTWEAPRNPSGSGGRRR